MHLVSFCSGQRLTQTFATGQSAEDKYLWCAQCSAVNKTSVPLQCSLSGSETSLKGRQETVRDRDHEVKWSSIFWTYRDPALRNSQQLWLATWGLISQHPVPRGGGSRAPIPTEDLFTVNGCWGMESQLSLRVCPLIDQQYYRGWYHILECIWAAQIRFGGLLNQKEGEVG